MNSNELTRKVIDCKYPESVKKIKVIRDVIELIIAIVVIFGIIAGIIVWKDWGAALGIGVMVTAVLACTGLWVSSVLLHALSDISISSYVIANNSSIKE